MNLSFIFPGQGSQKIGMGKELFSSFGVAKEVFQEVDDSLNENLSKLIFEGPLEDLTLTFNAQPAIMTVSIAALKVLESFIDKNIDQVGKFVAGHSLGEYSALVASRSLNLSDAARLLRLRGNAMQNAVAVNEGGMAAVIGSDMDAVKKLIDASVDKDEVLEIANDNAPGQIVISGHMSAIEKSVENSKNMGIKRVLKLPVSAPFHCSLMNSALEEMTSTIATININSPRILLCNNVEAKFLSDVKIIKDSLLKQIIGRVRWRESVENMRDLGKVSKFVELGAGNVLSGLIKRIDSNLDSVSLESITDIENFAKLV